MAKLDRLTFLFSLVNLGLFVWLVTQTGRVSAQDVPNVLRGRGLEIVDLRAAFAQASRDTADRMVVPTTTSSSSACTTKLASR